MTRRAPAPPPAQKDWAYFLDFDGTLLELAETPDAIQVDAELPEMLAALYRQCAGAVALISGRALSDLETRIPVPRLPKAGQHGLERRDAEGRIWLHAAPPSAKRAIRTALEPLLEQHKGLLLEDKGLTLALHYRQAPELATYLHHTIRRLLEKSGEGLMMQEGKKIFEIKPAGVDKGTAIAEYLAEPPFSGRRPVFIGDDVGDEHGFNIVNVHNGISIGVGSNSVAASYRLENVSAVRAWLRGVLEPAE